MDMPFKQIIDLGHEHFHDMSVLGGAQVSFWPLSTHKKLERISGGRVSMEARMMLIPEHCGTHLDVPRHCLVDGADVGSVPLEQLVLPGHLLDLTKKTDGEAITVADLEEAEEKSGQKIGGGTAVLCWTGVDRDWGKPGFETDRPYVPEESAQWLVDRGITLFGTDLIGMDDPDEWWWPTHRAWLEAGVCMIQQMNNLGALVGKEFILVAAPLKLRDGTGCPIRPIALVQ